MKLYEVTDDDFVEGEDHGRYYATKKEALAYARTRREECTADITITLAVVGIVEKAGRRKYAAFLLNGRGFVETWECVKTWKGARPNTCEDCGAAIPPGYEICGNCVDCYG